ncbi:MAG: metallophosphoesterase family protein [Chloroflexota bacterium]
MKIAVISDIHGNAVALEAVLEDLERRGGADCLVVPGDLFAFGPEPKAVYTILRQLPNARFLLGNTDRYLLTGAYPTKAIDDDWQAKLLLSFHWTAERLGSEGLRFLGTLPPAQRIQEGDRQLLAVHGSPRSDEEGLTPKTGAEHLREMSLDPQVAVLVGGHTHIPMDRLLNGVRLVNAGSVGLPFDGDPRACYVIISHLAAPDGRLTQVEFRRVIYDVEKAIKQFYTNGYPAADVSAYNLWTGRSIGSSLIYTARMRQTKIPVPTAAAYVGV